MSNYLKAIMSTDACPITRIAFYDLVTDNVAILIDCPSTLQVVENYSEQLKSSKSHLADISTALELEALKRCSARLQQNHLSESSEAAGLREHIPFDATLSADAEFVNPSSRARVSSVTLFETDQELEAWGDQVCPSRLSSHHLLYNLAKLSQHVIQMHSVIQKRV